SEDERRVEELRTEQVVITAAVAAVDRPRLRKLVRAGSPSPSRCSPSALRFGRIDYLAGVTWRSMASAQTSERG
ncbi:MAG TPA: hypothetical protein VNB52_00325, partial [Ilumatobacteraceae bacterium]|nr:hypothetical protein [Ilumatobacteraceae bacterium]